jgi:type III polyketide synthase
MSPSRVPEPGSDANGHVPPERFDGVELSIVGLGTEYPPFNLTPDDLDILVDRYYEPSPA